VFLADEPPDDFSDARLEIAGGVIDVRFQGRPGASRQQILQWIGRAGEAVSRYYGRFPVKHVTIQVRSGMGRIRNGNTVGGRRIRIVVGHGTKQADLDDDWIMTHEMFHLGFPDLPDRYNWMEEGLSTYLEPIARVRVGHLTPQRIWADMVEGMPRGLPRAGDRGLDNTPTHGRIYWGGCLFWLTADIEIRRRTDGKKSLDDAIRAILDAGGDGSADWPIDRVISVGDKATGTTVLAEVHERMGPQAEQTDLDALWRDLGVNYRRGSVEFDDKAPLAWVRKAIATPPASATTRPATRSSD
jgi:hypothetical protein